MRFGLFCHPYRQLITTIVKIRYHEITAQGRARFSFSYESCAILFVHIVSEGPNKRMGGDIFHQWQPFKWLPGRQSDLVDIIDQSAKVHCLDIYVRCLDSLGVVC